MNVKQYDNECHKYKQRIIKCEDEEEKYKLIKQLNALKLIYQITRIINKFETDVDSMNLYKEELKVIKERLG